MQSGGYVIGLDTPEEYYANLFASTLARRFPGLWVKRYFRTRHRLLEGTEVRQDLYSVRAVSRFLYDFLRPHKQQDFRWSIPSTVYHSRPCKRGFLQGIYDAEGGVLKSGPKVCLTSKHWQNLHPVRNLLREFGIETRPFQDSRCYRLFMYRQQDMAFFLERIGFRLPRKQRCLAEELLRKGVQLHPTQKSGGRLRNPGRIPYYSSQTQHASRLR